MDDPARTNLNLAVVRRMVEALNRGDWTEIEQHPGLKETRQRYPMLRSAFPDLTLEIRTEMTEGELVSLEMIMRGTHLGEFMGQAPTGRPFEAQVVSIDRLQDGKIVYHLAIPNWLSILGPLGLIRPL